jgi:hypothetical protein
MNVRWRALYPFFSVKLKNHASTFCFDDACKVVTVENVER